MPATWEAFNSSIFCIFQFLVYFLNNSLEVEERGWGSRCIVTVHWTLILLCHVPSGLDFANW